MTDTIQPRDVLDFWYSESMQRRWFNSTPQLDEEIRARYEHLWREARDGGLDWWKDTAEGCLALAIVLDQFPLNMFRGKASSFSTEQKAVAVTKHAVTLGFQRQLPRERLTFLFMPLMHSENLGDQDLSVRLFEEAGLEQNLRFARHHLELVGRFGRFPHRNAILGRDSSAEELAYLDSPDAFRG